MLAGADVERLGVEGLAGVFAAGVDWLQLRDRTREGASLLAAADVAREAATRAAPTARVIVNRRLDVALAARAHGAHLGYDALPPARARALLGPDAEIGFSAHAPDEVTAGAGASYAHLAPIFAPISKPAERAALGTMALEALRDARIPVLAQGGIAPVNAAAVIAAGAAGVAVTGSLSGADDPRRAAAALRSALDA